MKWWLLLLLALVAALGGWGYVRRDRLAWQYACHRLGQSKTFDEAAEQIAWFDAEPNRAAKLHELVGGWGRGSQAFDFYLAMHLAGPDCSEELRREFSTEIGWRPDLLPRWANCWSWRLGENLESEFGSVRDFLDTLVAADEKRSIGWREVLNLQAMFTLTRHEDLAKHLTTENWPGRYARWREREHDWPAELPQPELPFTDWVGPLPPLVLTNSAP